MGVCNKHLDLVIQSILLHTPFTEIPIVLTAAIYI